MSEIIQLRVLGFNRNGTFQIICLETDIAVSSETFVDAKMKMRDALLSYFKSFSEEEMDAYSFMRSAPKKYFALWYFISIAGFIKKMKFFFSSRAGYDPNSHKLSFA